MYQAGLRVALPSATSLFSETLRLRIVFILADMQRAKHCASLISGIYLVRTQKLNFTHKSKQVRTGLFLSGASLPVLR